MSSIYNKCRRYIIRSDYSYGTVNGFFVAILTALTSDPAALTSDPVLTRDVQ